MDWQCHFIYDETSPSCLRWVRHAANGRVKPGDIAGSLTGKKAMEKCYYRVFCVDKSYSVSRIIWEMFNGKIPHGMQIDHININPQDNRIENLRLITNLHNCQNRKKYKTNSSGVTGVTITSNGRGRLYWTAQWMDCAGKHIWKRFSIDDYGDNLAFEMTCKERQQAIAYLNNFGNMDYTERHGKKKQN